jgi:hypothetical protein
MEEQSLSAASAGISLADIVTTLQRLDTTEAALTLLECYSAFRGASDHFCISTALASMLDNETILSEMTRVRDTDVPTVAKRELGRTDELWPFGASVSKAFSELLSKVRNDMAWRLSSGNWDVMSPPNASGFRAKFPGILLFLSRQNSELTRDRWSELGFDVSAENLVLLRRIQRALRDGEVFIHLSRVTAPQSGLTRLLAAVCEILLTLTALAQMLLWPLIAFNFNDVAKQHPDPSQNTPVSVLLWVLAGSPLAWLIYIVHAVVRAQPGRKWRAFFSPIGQTLRRTRYGTRLHPWMNFVLAQLLCPAWVLPALFAMDLHMPVFAAAYHGVFLVFCIGFYQLDAMRIDAPIDLLLLHPVGRRILGISGPHPPESRVPLAVEGRTREDIF